MIDPEPVDCYGIGSYCDNLGQIDGFNRLMDPAGLVIGGVVKPRWLSDGVSFLYERASKNGIEIVHVDGTSGERKLLFERTALRGNRAQDLGYAIEEDIALDDVGELDGGQFRVRLGGRSVIVGANDFAGSSNTHEILTSDDQAEVDSASEQPRRPRLYAKPRWIGEPWMVKEAVSPDGRWFASTRDGNIVLRAASNDCELALTNDGSPDFGWDVESERPRVGAGMRFLSPTLLDPWSPDGQCLFAMKIDRRRVPQMPLIRHLGPEDEITMLRMQRAGGAIDIAHPHVVDIASGTRRALDVGNPENFYFALIGWRNDGTEVLFARYSRDLTGFDVLAGNTVTGDVHTVVSETGATFRAIWHELIFYGLTHVTILPGDIGLIVRSARTGWNHFYHYALDGTLRSALTRGAFAVTDVVGVDPERGWLYFCAHDDPVRPYDTHFCRVRLTGGPHQRLTSMDGENWIHLSPNTSAFVVTNSRPDRPWRSSLFRSDGTEVATLECADTSQLDAASNVVCEEFRVMADDKVTELWGVMFRPRDVQPGQLYPLIDHIYAGPQITMARHYYSLGHDAFQRLDRALAHLGYVVVSIDARGTPERSKAFHDTVHGRLGTYEINDHAAAIKELISRHAFIDPTRVGIWGHSWGGYFAIRGLAQAPDLFTVGVASSPSTHAYEAVYYEPHLGLLPQAKRCYELADNRALANRIRGKLLLTAGTCEPFLFSGIMKMVRALIDAQVDHDFVILPGGYHSYTGADLSFFVKKLVKHLAEHLGQEAGKRGRNG